MEEIHGVDTSWLHHRRGHRSASSVTVPSDQQNSYDLPAIAIENEKADASYKATLHGSTNGTGLLSDTKQPDRRNNGLAVPDAVQQTQNSGSRQPANPAVQHAANGTSSAPTQKSGKDNGKSSPGLGRKSSWISSLSSKFTSKNHEQKDQAHHANGNATTNKTPPSPKAEKLDPISVAAKDAKPEALTPPASPKPSGFLTALRRFSSSSGVTTTKTIPNGGICPRKVLNVDPHRDRCNISDLRPANLRRVAFCVDVEIAPTPAYRESSPEDPTITAAQQRKRSNSGSEKKNKVKNKERSEGEALKNPNSMVEKKEKSTSETKSGGHDMFEVPDVDEKPPKTENPAEPPRQPSPPKQQPSKTAVPKRKSPLSTPLHHDFGPNGMFEVDDFDDVPEKTLKVPPRRGSTGGSPHHDFGRHGMFEIPSESEDEAPAPGRPKPTRKTSTSPDRPALPGHVYTEHLMFELPDEEQTIAEAIEEATSQASLSEKETLAPVQNVGGTPAADVPTTEPREAARNTETVAEAPAGGEATDKAAAEDAPTTTRKKEKKKKSEEERKERKEKKRQAAIANGSIPVELTSNANPSGAQQPAGKPKIQNRPTTDPLRIYRRCCSLRETQPLPRVVEHLSSPSACDPLNPAIVLVLDLSGQEIQMSDLVTLADWLGVVPVQRLILDGCGLTDETLRVILSALLAVKTVEQTRHNKHLAKKSAEKAKDRKERTGVISKLSLKDNKLIGRQGWMHIGCFVNMSKSLKAIDLSMIPFPKKPPTTTPNPSPPSTASGHPPGSREGPSGVQDPANADPFDLFCKCLAARKGGQLEEIVMSECDLSGDRIEKLIDAIIACKCNRFGLAHNHLDRQGIQAIAKYMRSGHCIGIDLGGNDFSDLESQKIILDAIDFPENKMWAISLASTNISPSDLKAFLNVISKLKDFRLLDLSHNHKLFEDTPNAIPVLNRYLPKMAMLKRLLLNDTAMKSEHAIAFADIIPEVPTIAHISILDNPALTALASAQDEATQEEACALYASLMAAVRVSSTLVCIDIDVPSKDNSEVVKALAKQVVAYSLRNMEQHEAYQSAATLISEPHGGEEAVTVPDILLHIVGHIDQPDDADDDEPPAPDQDYLVGGTGVVKALSVVLGNKSNRDNRRLSRDLTPQQSGSNTPKLGDNLLDTGKAKDMSKSLLRSARKIRHRLQPALVRARVDNTEDSDNYRECYIPFRGFRGTILLTSAGRLFYLDTTLERMIQRFEDEYPECKQARPRGAHIDLTATSSPDPVNAHTHESAMATALRSGDGADDDAVGSGDEDATLASSLRRSRHGSDVSLASRYLMNEEGRLHRFGQQMKRNLQPVEAQHIDVLREKLEAMDGDSIKQEVETKGVDAVLNEIGATIEELRELEQQGGGVWEKCKNAGMRCGTEGTSGKSDPEALDKAKREQMEQMEKIAKMDSAIDDEEEADSGLEITA